MLFDVFLYERNAHNEQFYCHNDDRQNIFFGLFLTYIPPFQNTCRFSHMIKTDAKFILHKIVRKIELQTHAKQIIAAWVFFFHEFQLIFNFFFFWWGRGCFVLLFQSSPLVLKIDEKLHKINKPVFNKFRHPFYSQV